MGFFSLLILYWTILHSFNAISIGIINNASLTRSSPDITMNALKCNDCLCVMSTSSTDLTILSLNCITGGTVNVVCQFFSNATYSGFNSSQIKINLNSTFYFRILSLNDSSRTTLPSVLTAATMTTEKKTSSTSTASTASRSTTTQNPVLASLSGGSLTEDTWTMYTYSYRAAVSTNLTLKFTFQSGNKHDWYLDDVSVQNSTSTELMINGDFESTPSFTGWLWGSSGSCSSNSGISSTIYHSSDQSYHHGCGSTNTWIYQSFAAINGQVYNITFWLYYDRTGSGVGSGTDQLSVTMN